MNLLQIFTTPLWESQLPNFDQHRDDMLSAVEKHKNENPELVEKYNIRSYVSPTNLTKVKAFEPLLDYVSQLGMKAAFDCQLEPCDIYVTSAWSHVMDGKQGMMLEHEHPDTFSGVFFLQVPKNSGKLVLINRGINKLWQGQQLVVRKNKFTAEKLHVEPSPGRIFIWPSYLGHAVEPNNHDEARISINFNLICLDKNMLNEITNNKSESTETK